MTWRSSCGSGWVPEPPMGELDRTHAAGCRWGQRMHGAPDVLSDVRVAGAVRGKTPDHVVPNIPTAAARVPKRAVGRAPRKPIGPGNLNDHQNADCSLQRLSRRPDGHAGLAEAAGEGARNGG